MIPPPTLSAREAEPPVWESGEDVVSWGAAADSPLPVPEVTTHSGTPLLLEFGFDASARPPEALEIETPRSRLSFDVPEAAEASRRRGGAGEQPGRQQQEADDQAGPRITATPFLSPGVYPMSIRLSGEDKTVTARFEVGFADFVWGRDNFRFGNNASYESRIGDYSEVLAEWLEERFGAPADEEEPDRAVEHAVLTYYMYSMFGTNAGRCYAFVGSQLRYLRFPELLPSYHETVYDVRAANSRVQREMHYLQFDIVADYFLGAETAGAPTAETAGGSPSAGAPTTETETGRPAPTADVSAVEAVTTGEPQGRAELIAELERVRAGIAAGRPVLTGFTASDLHHAMLVYGYIIDHARARVDLIVANNWKDEEQLNLRSRDAHIIRIQLAEEHGEEPPIAWITPDGPRRRTPNRLFVVEVQKEYEPEYGPVRALVARRLEELRERGTALVVAENAGSAWLTDGEGNVTGYKDRRSEENIEEVTFDRVQRSVLFELPAGREYTLHVPDPRADEEEEDGRAGVRIFHVGPRREAPAGTYAGFRAWDRDSRDLPARDDGEDRGEDGDGAEADDSRAAAEEGELTVELGPGGPVLVSEEDD